MTYDEALTIPPLTVRTAANRLGWSTWAVHKAIDRGELRPVTRNPIQVAAMDVEALRERKRNEAIERIGLDRMAKVARDVRLHLHPPFEAGGPRGHAALEKVSETVKAAFTMPLMHAAAMPDGSGCRWCAAEIAGRILSVPVRSAMLSSEFGVALLGGPECERHRELVAGRMRELGTRVHPGGGRTAGGRTEDASVVVPSAPAAPAAPRTRSAQPLQADDGRGLVARRLRTARARLKDAKRRGDQRYAIQLAKTIRGLESDAAVVDGRVTASARPGTLRCGHQLAANCACPRIASKRSSS
ncbi:hypothetical protein [Streptomyces lincolnensis]|uniref:hypothetical protein n=1 Tax=Streptomyces lincolnensis TaxID=1915 RepID=UPI0037D34923